MLCPCVVGATQDWFCVAVSSAEPLTLSRPLATLLLLPYVHTLVTVVQVLETLYLVQYPGGRGWGNTEPPIALFIAPVFILAPFRCARLSK